MTPVPVSDTAIWLAFPPGAIEASMPELGIPQLAAGLRQQQVSLRAFDLNLSFWHDFMSQAKPRRQFLDILKKADTRRRFGIDDATLDRFLGDFAAPDFAFTPISMLRPRGRSSDNAFTIMHIALATMGMEPPDYRLETLLDELRRPHPLLDAYFEYWIGHSNAPPPSLAGFSIAVAPQILSALWLANKLKQRFPGVTTVMGGPWVSMARPYMQSWLGRFSMMDAAVIFEGHAPLLALHRDPQAGDIPGLLRRHPDGSVTGDARHEPPALDDLPPADFGDFPLDAYLDRVLPVQSSRNCSWGRCTFCYHHRNSAAPSHQRRSAAGVVEHMAQHIQRYGVRGFFIADSCPTTTQIVAIGSEILRRNLDVTWYVMPRITGEWTKEKASTVALSGLRHVYMGLETVSDVQRRRIDKGSDLDMARHDLANLAAAGIDISLFIMDLPGQSARELIATYQWVLRHHSLVQNIIAQKFRLGRNTRAFEDPGILGVHPTPDHHSWLDVFGIPYAADSELSPRTFAAIDTYFMNAFNALSHGAETIESLECSGTFKPIPPALAPVVA